MRRHPLMLVALLFIIGGLALWSRWPAPPAATTIQPIAAAQANTGQDSPPPTPTVTPTPPPPMPTPAEIATVEADWQTITFPYWGISFQIPPDWVIESNGHRLLAANMDSATHQGGWIPGPPLELLSTNENEGRIQIFLAQSLLSDGGSLAEWIWLNQQYSPAMGVMRPPSNMNLYTIPAAYLPAGVEQGIYSFNSVPLRPYSTIWLTYNGLVLHFNSTYNRAEDMARIFAIISSMEFTPIPDERLRDSNSFDGDENDMRGHIAAAGPLVPPCEWDCQLQESYNERMAHIEASRRKLLDQRPLVEPIQIGDYDVEQWITYTHPILGISFRHDPSWTVNDPFAEEGLGESAAVGKPIRVRYADGREIASLELLPYTVSAGVPLHNWEALFDQLYRATTPINHFPYRLIVPIDVRYMPLQADDVVHVREQAAYYQLEDFFISKDGVVLRVTNRDHMFQHTTAALLSTVEFDTAQLAELRAASIFAGDERAMLDALAAQWATPATPTPELSATATPFPTITPYPTWTPTPTPVRVTVTPSAFESPLVRGLKHYQGPMEYSNTMRFDIAYDPDRWHLTTFAEANVPYRNLLFLAHQTLKGCEIHVGLRGFHAISLAPIDLAGRAWSISYLGGNGYVYSSDEVVRGVDRGFAYFFVELPDPLPELYDPANKSQCELDAEAVLDTLTIVGDDAAMSPTATPPPTPTPGPTVRATVTPAAKTPALLNGLQVVQRPSLYGDISQFKLWYDPQVWALAVDESDNEYLVNLSIPDCEITLRAELPYHVGLPPVTLNGVEWSLAYPMETDGNYLAYTRVIPGGAYTYLLALPTPTSAAVYDQDDKSPCQLAAETLLATHELLAVLPTITPRP